LKTAAQTDLSQPVAPHNSQLKMGLQ